jgi:hypothetical protein
MTDDLLPAVQCVFDPEPAPGWPSGHYLILVRIGLVMDPDPNPFPRIRIFGRTPR